MHIAGLSRRVRWQSNLKSRVGISETEINMDKTLEEGNSLQVIYSNVPVNQQNNFQNRIVESG